LHLAPALRAGTYLFSVNEHPYPLFNFSIFDQESLWFCCSASLWELNHFQMIALAYPYLS